MVAWLAATLAGSVEPGTALSAIQYDSDGQVAIGWPDGAASCARLISPRCSPACSRPASALLRWPCRWPAIRSGLPAPGLSRRPRSTPKRRSLLATDGVTFGLIPTRDLRGSSYRGWRWQVFVELASFLLSQPRSTPTLHSPRSAPCRRSNPCRSIEQTDRALNRALRDATADLAALDLAHWRPEVAAGRKEAEAALRVGRPADASRVAGAGPRARRALPHAVAHRAGRPRRFRCVLGVG